MSVIERYHWHVSDEVEFKKLHREFFDQYKEGWCQRNVNEPRVLWILDEFSSGCHL